MEAKATKREKSPRKRAIGRVGICAGCTSLAICRYPKSIQNPVMFCEEFNTLRANPRRRENVLEPVLVEASLQIGVNKEKFSRFMVTWTGAVARTGSIEISFLRAFVLLALNSSQNMTGC